MTTNTMIKILFAEDDANLGAIMTERLKMKGFDVHHYTDGEKAISAFKKDKFDLVILDIMMPVKDGFTLAKEIKAFDDMIPLIFVTARSMKEDVIKGFNVGADDYITKPFSMDELIMRINAVMKRTRMIIPSEPEPEVFNISKFEFNSIFQSLHIADEEHKLTSKESELLKILCMNKNEVVSREVALKKIWGDDTYFNGRSMDVFISKLRKLLSSDEAIEIMNVHGKGFKLIVKE